ncbi:MAG: right-handed parallel beta-helix repeat-containing protein [Planctomycetota bacterium]
MTRIGMKLGVGLVIVCAVVAACPVWGQTTRTVTVRTGAAIQAAIDLSAPGDTVELLGGDAYVLSGKINAKSGVNIVGAGIGQTVLTATGSFDRFIEMEGVNNVTLRGLTMDGTGSGLSYGVVAWNGSGHTIDRIEVKELSGPEFGPLGVYFSTNVTDSSITNSEFSEIGTDADFGGGIRVAMQSKRVTVEGNTVTNTGRGGIFFNDGSSDAVIRNNTVTGSGLEAFGLGIELQNDVDGSVVEGNTIDSWLSVDNSQRVAVRDNKIGSATATDFKFAGLELVDVTHVVLADNDVLRGTDVGLSFSGQEDTEGVIVARNEITRSNTFSAQLQGDDNEDGNVLAKVLLLENKLTDGLGGTGFVGDGFGDGLRLNANVEDLLAVGNEITGHAGQGLSLLGQNERLRFIDNEIKNNAGDGVHPTDGASLPTDLQWLNNVVSGNGSDAQPVSQGFADGFQTVSLGAVGELEVGEAVTLSVTPSLGFVPDAVLWDLGYGTPVLGLSVDAVFDGPGEYEVTVLAYDDLNVAYDTVMITVVPEPATLTLTGLSVLLGTLRLGGRRRARRMAEAGSRAAS